MIKFVTLIVIVGLTATILVVISTNPPPFLTLPIRGNVFGSSSLTVLPPANELPGHGFGPGIGPNQIAPPPRAHLEPVSLRLTMMV